MLGEALALVRKRALDPAAVLDILTSTMFGSRIHKLYGAKIVTQRFVPPGFALPLALKDVRLVLAEADAPRRRRVERDPDALGQCRARPHDHWSGPRLYGIRLVGSGSGRSRSRGNRRPGGRRVRLEAASAAARLPVGEMTVTASINVERAAIGAEVLGTRVSL